MVEKALPPLGNCTLPRRSLVNSMPHHSLLQQELLDVLKAFESALMNFPGPVLAISHDRRFIQRFSKVRWTLADSQLLKDESDIISIDLAELPHRRYNNT